MNHRRLLAPGLVAALVVLLGAGMLASSPTAQALEDDGGASWHLEQPAPPAAPAGDVEAPSPIGLGRIGDIAFAPGMTNRGALITAGNPPTIEPGVWEFNGVSWHQLSTVCGASDGRIVWSGPEEFWTISNGRPGQQANYLGDLPPTRDNTLCRFSNSKHEGEPLRVMESFAFPAFETDSYQVMNATGCLSSTDCWFAGEPTPSENAQAGSFHLHWNGSTLSEEPYPAEAYPVESMEAFDGRLYESVRINEKYRDENEAQPAPLHVIYPEGASEVFEGLPWEELPLYETGEFPAALDFLHLSASGEILWGAAGPQTTPAHSKPGQLTVAVEKEGIWQQVLGPESTVRAGKEAFPELTATSIAAEPGTDSAWITLDSPSDYAKATSPLVGSEPSRTARAEVTRIETDGTLSKEDIEELPDSDEPTVGPKGAAFTMACPGPHDCWLATTYGWLFHLSTPQEQQEKEAGSTRDDDPAFETLITERPPDRGIPVTVPVTLAVDDSGLLGELATAPSVPRVEKAQLEGSRVTAPLLSHVHSKLVHGTTLELRFHLAVKARLKLLAKRHKHVVAASAERTFAAGNRSLQVRLNPKLWPTKLELKHHALAPLPTETLNESNQTTITTSLEFPNALGQQALSGFLR
jgi:hypothetical protein